MHCKDIDLQLKVEEVIFVRPVLGYSGFLKGKCEADKETRYMSKVCVNATTKARLSLYWRAAYL